MTRTMETDLQPRVSRGWSGADGLAQLARWGRFAAPDPDRFRAEWRAVRVDGVQIGEWRSTPFTGFFPPSEPAAIALDTVVSGRLRYRIDGTTTTGETGSIHLVRAQSTSVVAAESPLRLARILLLEEHVPQWLQRTGTIPVGPLREVSLSSGFVAFVDRLTATLRENPEPPPIGTAKAIAGLTTALLEEVFPAGSSTGSLRDRIIGFIDRHLADPDLGPRRIADEFDISLRWVHQVFNQEGESIARSIRERRADAVAAALRSEQRLVRVGELAIRFGFAGRDQLTRTFKQRYGMTVNDYLDAVADGDVPVPTATGC